MKKIVTSMDFQFDPEVHAHKVEGKSMTVPGHDLSIKDLLTRYVNHRPLPLFESIFDGEGEESFYDLMTLDKLERADLKRELEGRVLQESANLDATRRRIKEKTDALKKSAEKQVNEPEGGAGIATT